MPAPHAIALLIDDDPQAWDVHTDALLEDADPRATLVREQTGAPTPHGDLFPHHRQLIEAHGLLGPIRRPSRHRLSWKRGYWHGFGNWYQSQADDWWRGFFSHESARLLQDLSMRWIDPAFFLELLQTHPVPLRRLHWNERDEPVDLDPFFEALPTLTDLRLWRPGRFSTGPQDLRGLAVNTGEGNPGLREDLTRHARDGGFAELVELEAWGTDAMRWVGEVLQHCRPTRLSYMGSVPGDIVDPLLDSPGFAGLEELRLEGFWPHDDALERLVKGLEDRERPLRRYASTGREPTAEMRERLARVADVVLARG